LVETNEGYFLFREDLKQGRLVSTSLERTWVNLSSAVPVFDNEMVMEAGQTPKAGASPVLNGLHAMNGVEVGSPNGTIRFAADGTHVINSPGAPAVTGITAVNNGTSVEVEMDMS
jgi:hypothetical protein